MRVRGRGADEEIFRKARLSLCAVVAKVHTIDWTVELLNNPILRTAMRGNWYGLMGEYALRGKSKYSTAYFHDPSL